LHRCDQEDEGNVREDRSAGEAGPIIATRADVLRLADVWLDPEFPRWDIREGYLPKIASPVLAIQGYDDEYGTMAQLDESSGASAGPASS